MQILANPSASKQPVDTKELREKQALARSQLLRNNAGYIPAFAVQHRRNFFSAKVNCCAGRHSTSAHTVQVQTHAVSFAMPSDALLCQYTILCAPAQAQAVMLCGWATTA